MALCEMPLQYLGGIPLAQIAIGSCRRHPAGRSCYDREFADFSNGVWIALSNQRNQDLVETMNSSSLGQQQVERVLQPKTVL